MKEKFFNRWRESDVANPLLDAEVTIQKMLI